MLNWMKGLFGKKDRLPEGVVMVDEPMAKLSAAISMSVSMQAVMGGLDDDPRNWTRDERATVMGYIDGQVTAMYQPGDERVPLASYITSVEVFQKKRAAEQVMDDRERYVADQDAVFMKAAHVGFADCQKMQTRKNASQLGLVELLRPELAG